MFTLTPFKPDTEGVWQGLPADVYHAAPGVSQSRLKEFGEYASPLHYGARKPKLRTPDMEFGTICHTAVLEPEKLAGSYYVWPATYPAKVKGKKGEPETTTDKPWHAGADWCKDWTAKHRDKPCIEASQEYGIPKIVARLKALPEFGSALTHGSREVSFFKKDDATGLLLKCRVDVMARDDEGWLWLFDAKKVQSGGASEEEFQRSMLNYGYHIQAASYLWITGAQRFVFVPFDDAPPFDACQWEPDATLLEAGRFEWRRLLDSYAAYVQAVSEDRYPGYGDGIKELKLPPWAKRKLTTAQHDEWTMRVLAGSV